MIHVQIPAIKRVGGALMLPVLVILLYACQRVVSIDLNQANPQMVIEGVVTNQGGPYKVVLSKTGDYFTPSLTFPQVSNALVVINDNAGIADTLNNAGGGTYVSSHLQGVPGRVYTLRVFAEGKEYDATSPMPEKVRIDTLIALPMREFDGDRGYNLYIVFTDPSETPNWYRVEAHTHQAPVDSVTGRRFLLFNDKLTNGSQTTFRIRAARSANPGDTVTVRLYSIDKGTYDYYNTVNDVLASDRSPTSLSPANPNTNLSNGSLGYFAAFAIDSLSVVLR